MTRDLAGLSRAALVLAGAAALGACGKEQGGPRDNTSIAAPYGAPPLPEDATAPPPLPRDAGTGTGTK